MTNWTSPKTWVTGELVDAATLNTHLRDNLLYLKDRGAYTYVQRTANYTLNSPGVGSTGWLNVDTANLTLTHDAQGGLLMPGASFTTRGSVETYGTLHFDIEVDGVRLGGPSGLLIADYTLGTALYHTYRMWSFLPPGINGLLTVRLQWRLDSINGNPWTGNIYDEAPVTLYVKEFAQ